MKHFIIVLVAGLITLTVMFVLYRPDLVEDIWLWIIGLIGPIIVFTRELMKSLTKFLTKSDTETQ